LIVDVKDYPDGIINVDEVRRCDPAIESQFKRSRLRHGDVLLSIRGTIGRVAVVPHTLDGHNISRDSARLSGEPSLIRPDFLRLLLESPDVQNEIRRTTTGLAVKGINIARIRALMVPHWTLSEQDAACARLAQIEDAIAASEEGRRTATAIRSRLSESVFGGAA
jgi:type I restriction enzyme S subunit